MYGYLIDNVIEFTVLLENGDIVKANKDNQYSDLYWALAGSGHGGFGIVVDFKIKLYPIEPYYYENAITYALKDTNRLFEIINTYMESLEKCKLNRIGVSIDTRFNNVDDKVNCTLIYFYNGAVDQGELEFKKFYNLFKIGGLDVQVEEFDGSKIKKSILDIIKSVPLDNGTFRQYSKCRFIANLNKDISKTYKEIIDLGLETKNKQLIDSSDQFEISASIYYQGGKQSQYDPNINNSFIHRGDDYNWTVVIICKYNNEANDVPFLKYKGEINKRMPIFHNQIYQNYPDDDITNWQEAYYGYNYPKLQQIKLKYDPNNYFKFPQSIELPNNSNNNNNDSNNFKHLIKF
ncbi:hypothetical protein DICPUDRAFT_92909 [Dictyostelium purpureum]|uniref:Berberine/berberine-like domain-containing protein n=1 Tax=Dictyostelium purpureum TaxID=5786 RepID=F0ZZ39_DICPU|nr:uncharacterized protein DICPUDRAFT_92909 [Dictyostelium purpureum]EGC30797.1 hypothetical protein DICPUDRAFT_92909 [Dictyostelium purpureum]|eukprot:XP_003292687.1 hypothetical protein DICPUDRAFT_92909 [Dictyostelium purpureum]